MRLVELSHVLRDGMPVYPGLPAARIYADLDHAASRSHYDGRAEFYLGHLDIPANVGTYLDAPFHRYPDRPDLSRISLDRVAALPGLVVDANVGADRSITAECLPEELPGCALLVRTGWSSRWDTPEYWDLCPYLSPAMVDLAIRGGAALVGTDAWQVDDARDPSRPAHTRLLGEGILVVEHLCGLDKLPRSGFRFFAVPLRIEKGASAPVRAFAEIG